MARLLRLTESGLKKRIFKYRIPTVSVDGQPGMWIKATDVPMLVAAKKAKPFFLIHTSNGKKMAIPNPKVGAYSRVYLTQPQRMNMVKLWHYVRGLGRKRYTWEAFLSQCLGGCSGWYQERIASHEKFWQNWVTHARDLEPKQREARPMNRGNWPTPVSVPEWLLKEEHRHGRHKSPRSLSFSSPVSVRAPDSEDEVDDD